MKKLITYFIVVFSILGLYACLEDKGYSDITKGVGKKGVISIYGGNTGLNLKTVGLDFVVGDQNLTVFSITGTGLASPVTTTLKLDPTYLTKYNDQLAAEAKANGDTTALGIPIYTAYLMLPPTSYSIPSLDVPLAKGTSDGKFVIKVNSSTIPLTNKYLLPFAIASISGDPNAVVASNLFVGLVSVVVKNIYEATYTSTGFVFHPSAPRSMDDEKPMLTVDATTSEYGLGDLYGSGFYFRFAVGGTNDLINFLGTQAAPSPANGGSSGFMTQDNPGGTNFSSSAPNAPGVAPWTSAIYNNKYDPATKTFFMHYGYRFAPGVNQNAYNRQFYEKLVRK